MHFANLTMMHTQTVHTIHKQELVLNSFRYSLLKRICTVLVTAIAIIVFGENVADAAAHLINKVIIAPASEPMTMFVIGSGLVLVATYWRKNITKK